jgi:hypothetical protein
VYTHTKYSTARYEYSLEYSLEEVCKYLSYRLFLKKLVDPYSTHTCVYDIHREIYNTVTIVRERQVITKTVTQKPAQSFLLSSP